MIKQEYSVIYASAESPKKVSVIIPLYNYAHHIIETLESVKSQTFKDIQVVVIDDCSTDESLSVTKTWMEDNSLHLQSFLIQNRTNSRLSITRNTGISFAKSEYCFMLDADNIIFPRCIEKHVSALDNRLDAVAAYSLIEVFEGSVDVIGTGVFIEDGLRHGNFIDAMAMFRRSALIELDGYENMRHGWEDYDLWLRIMESNNIAIHIPDILSRYRQHNTSMLRTETNISKNIKDLHEYMKKRHPWLELH